MCPELSQDVSQDHFSRAFYPEAFIYDKFELPHIFSNLLPASCGTRYKPPEGHDGAPNSLQCMQPSRAISSIGMVGDALQGQQPYAATGDEASVDYSLEINGNSLIPEIDCDWMKDVLDDLLLSSRDHEIPPLPPLSVTHSTAIGQVPSLLSPLCLTSKVEAPGSPASPSVRIPEVARLDATQLSEHNAVPKSPARAKVSSPTPEPLKTRASKRLQREVRSRKLSKWAQKSNLASVDPVEHVIRERQRRDDMSCKIATLEGLLPQGPKRDRASVVHDSVEYVKALQQRVEELSKRAADLHLRRPAPSPVMASKQLQEGTRASSPKEPQKPFRLVNFHVEVKGGGDAATVANCRCKLNFLSLTMKSLEELQLDLCSSSVTKMPEGSFFCVIASKPRLETSSAIQSASLALKIKSAVEVY